MIKTFSSGILGANTHLFYDENSDEGIVVDCGNDPSEVNLFCMQKGINVKYVVLTHGHYDHAHFFREYKNTFKSAKTVCHRDEIPVLTNAMANVSILFGDSETYPLPDETVTDGDELTVGRYTFRVIHTPGHTPGGICLYCEEEKLMFTGDTLFCGGIGRTDFLYGDEAVMISSLQMLLNMDGEIEFYSGHGCEGKIKNERYF